MTIHLPIAPLFDILTRTYGPMETQGFAHCCGVSRSTVKRWRLDGLSVWRADEVAIKVLQIHPSYVWDDWDELSLAAANASVKQKGVRRAAG